MGFLASEDALAYSSVAAMESKDETGLVLIGRPSCGVHGKVSPADPRRRRCRRVSENRARTEAWRIFRGHTRACRPTARTVSSNEPSCLAYARRHSPLWKLPLSGFLPASLLKRAWRSPFKIWLDRSTELHRSTPHGWTRIAALFHFSTRLRPRCRTMSHHASQVRHPARNAARRQRLRFASCPVRPRQCLPQNPTNNDTTLGTCGVYGRTANRLSAKSPPPANRPALDQCPSRSAGPALKSAAAHADGTQRRLSQYSLLLAAKLPGPVPARARPPRTPERPGRRARAPQVVDAVVPLQVRRHGVPCSARYLGVATSTERISPISDATCRAPRPRAGSPDRSPGGQRGQPVAQVQLDLHVRVALEERRNQRRDDLPPQRHRRGHGQHAPPARQVLHGRVARLDALEGGGGLLDQVRARLRQADATRRAAPAAVRRPFPARRCAG